MYHVVCLFAYQSALAPFSIQESSGATHAGMQHWFLMFGHGMGAKENRGELRVVTSVLGRDRNRKGAMVGFGDIGKLSLWRQGRSQ